MSRNQVKMVGDKVNKKGEMGEPEQSFPLSLHFGAYQSIIHSEEIASPPINFS